MRKEKSFHLTKLKVQSIFPHKKYKFQFHGVFNFKKEVERSLQSDDRKKYERIILLRRKMDTFQNLCILLLYSFEALCLFMRVVTGHFLAFCLLKGVQIRYIIAPKYSRPQ